MSKLSFLLIIIVIPFLFSCSKKLSTITGTGSKNKELKIDEVDFDYFTAKAKLKYKDNENDVNARANVRIKKDSIIWINFTSAGISGGRCLINRDSIVLLSILKKEYYVFTYQELTDRFKFKVDFDRLQSVTLGNLIIPKAETDQVSENNGFQVLSQRETDISIKNFVNPQTSKIEKIEMFDGREKNTADINYKNFQQIDEQVFPFSGLISLVYQTSNGPVNTVIDIEYIRAEVSDKPLKFPFNISKKYERR
ncbi:MAG: DUF4292 domain-containing protein [Bacteroidota bacterium]